MSKETKRSNSRSPGMTLLAILALVILGGLIYYVKNGPSADLKPVNQVTTAPDIQITVPVAKQGGPNATFGSTTTKVPSGTDPVVASINGYLASLPMVQPEARVLETHRQGANLELVFTSNFRVSYSTDDESTILKGIMHAVKSNSDAKTVTLVEGGKPIESLGAADLAGPQSVREWTGG